MTEFDVTVDTLKLALRGLDEGFGGRPELTPDEQERLLDNIASAALDALVVACKYLLGTHGRLAVPGLGTLVASTESSGRIELVPEADLAEYLNASFADIRVPSGIAHLIWAHLRLAAELLEAHPHLRKVAVPESLIKPSALDLRTTDVARQPPSLEQAIFEQFHRIRMALDKASEEDSELRPSQRHVRDSTADANGRVVYEQTETDDFVK